MDCNVPQMLSCHVQVLYREIIFLVKLSFFKQPYILVLCCHVFRYNQYYVLVIVSCASDTEHAEGGPSDSRQCDFAVVRSDL